MADAVLQLVSRLPSVTGLAEDITENVINVKLDDIVAEASITDAMEAFRDFYIATGTGQAQDVGNYISASVSRAANACSILAYITNDFSGATPFGAPLDSLSFTMSAVGNAQQLPNEVAAVISTHADLTGVPVSQTNPDPPPATIRPQQRRRGRMFIGPLAYISGSVVGGFLRPDPVFREDLGDAFKNMANAINPLTDVLHLGIWSKADEQVWEIVGGYVDDAFDTQRRRGVAPTLRTSFTV